jgi:cytochrome c biogenesis protein CcmG, thiol:disulfide interchange protein DsbE
MAVEPGAGHLARQLLKRIPALLALGGVLALVILLAYGLTTKSPDATIDTQLSGGRSAAAPGFNLEVLQVGNLGPRLAAHLPSALRDKHIDLDELRGMPVVLNFWASWCPPCRTEAPLLQRGWQQARPAGTLFVGLDQQDVTGDAHDFLREFHTDYLNVRDPPGEVAHRWGVTGLPETFFISARGEVVDHVIGAVSAAQLRNGIAAARAGLPRRAQQGGARRPTR